MNSELDFLVRQEQYKDYLKEAEQHRLWSKNRKSKNSRKEQSASKKRSSRLAGSKIWKEAFEGRS